MGVYLKGGLRHSVMTPRAGPETLTQLAHLHTQSNSWGKTVHRAQFRTAELLCLSRAVMLLSLKSERPLAPAQLKLPRPGVPRKLRLCDIPRGCVFLSVLRDCGTGAGPGREQESASTAQGPINMRGERTGKFAFHCWQFAQPPFPPVCLCPHCT